MRRYMVPIKAGIHGCEATLNLTRYMVSYAHDIAMLLGCDKATLYPRLDK